MRCLLATVVGVFVLGATLYAADNPLKQVQTIPLDGVEGRIDHMCLDATGRHLFIAALGNNSVEIVDTQGGIHSGGIGTAKEPQGVVYIPDSRKLVVSSGQDNQCRIYDQALTLLGTVEGLEDADNVRYDAQARLVYVGYGNGALAAVDPDKATKVADIRLDGHPESFQLEANGTRIFVNIPSAHQIAVIDRQKRTVLVTWPVPGARANFPMALDEANHRLFVGCREPAKLIVFDTESGNTVTRFDCAGDTDDVFYDAARRRIYISGGAGSISVFEQSDPDHYKLLATVPTAAGARTSLFDPDYGRLFVAVPHRGQRKAEVRVFQTQDTHSSH